MSNVETNTAAQDRVFTCGHGDPVAAATLTELVRTSAGRPITCPVAGCGWSGWHVDWSRPSLTPITPRTENRQVAVRPNPSPATVAAFGAVVDAAFAQEVGDHPDHAVTVMDGFLRAVQESAEGCARLGLQAQGGDWQLFFELLEQTVWEGSRLSNAFQDHFNVAS